MKISFIRMMVKEGIAQDITNFSYSEAINLIGKDAVINLSFGIYGINGALVRNTLNGKLYAILSRNSLLFQLV